MAFLAMKLLGIGSNIMSLGGIAIAIGAMIDAAIVMIENAHKHLERAPPVSRASRFIEAAAEVGPALFFVAARDHGVVPADLHAGIAGRTMSSLSASPSTFDGSGGLLAGIGALMMISCAAASTPSQFRSTVGRSPSSPVIRTDRRPRWSTISVAVSIWRFLSGR